MKKVKQIKQHIIDLAYAAVQMAEDCLESEPGREKKKAAIAYIMEMLPVASIFKGLIAFFLSAFIDEAVENAVRYMNKVKAGE